MYKESYQVQNATARLFLSDCSNKPKVKAALESLNIQTFVGSIESALMALVTAIALRKDKTVSELNEKETREIRHRLNANLNRMFRYMEVMSDVAPGGPLDTMIKRINVSIQKIETAVKKRTNKSPVLEETEMS